MLAVVLIVTCVLGAILVSFYAGAKFGRIYEFHNTVFELPKARNVSVSFRALLNLQPSYSQFGQDSWVASAIAPGKTNGFYVDVGSEDGEAISNTKLLDQMGWKGVCIDPFPKNMEKRTCHMVRQPAFSESGKKVQFRAAGIFGGIESSLGKHKHETSDAPLVEFVTTTLDEILDKAKAPQWIDYISIDAEGAEYDVLRGLSLDRYQVGAFTIEHNYEFEKREQIQKLLEEKGYVRVRSWEVDDWYVHRDLAKQYTTFIAYSSKEWTF